MPIFYYPSKESPAASQIRIDHSDRDAWERLLSPHLLKVATQEGWETLVEFKAFKDSSRALSALEFPHDAPMRRAPFAVGSWGLVLDVDDKVVLPFAELRSRLDGIQFICFSSFNSTEETPRWRVVLPFEDRAPLSYMRSLWDYVNESVFDGLLSTGTRDPTRLGFFGTTRDDKTRSAYTWHFNPGVCLDWRALESAGIITESAPQLDELNIQCSKERKPHWTSRTEAIAEATKFFVSFAGGVRVGGRHDALFKASCALWWGWAAEDAEFVYSVLHAMNEAFEDPKDDQEVKAEVTAGYRRTIEEAGPAQSVDYGSKREPSVPFSREGVAALVEDLRRRVKRTRDRAYKNRMTTAAGLLVNALKGQVLCEADSLHLMEHLYFFLTEEFSRNPVEHLANFLEPSLGATRSKYPHLAQAQLSRTLVRGRILHFQQAALVRKDRQVEKIDEDRADSLRELFEDGRDWPYTQEELETWREESGLKEKKFLLQRKGDYYPFFNGTYLGPKSEKEMEVLVHRLALPMPNITTYTRTDKGAVKALPVVEVARNYGDVIDEVELDYNVGRSKYHKRDAQKVLTMAAGARAPLNPKFSHDVDQWLRLISGSKYELFLDYLAAFTQLEYAIPCLFLHGATGTGKSAFVKALSRLYSRGEPLSLEHATSRFNRGLMDTPIILCDERIPENVKKSGQTTAIFRNFIQRTDHLVEIKNGEFFVLKGAVRLLITANNLSVLTDDKELLSSLDVDGTINRFLLLEVSPTAKDFLESLEVARFQEIQDRDLASHVVWLGVNRSLDYSKRFLGLEDPDRAALKAAIVTTKEVPSLLCELVVTAIMRPNTTAAKGLLFAEDGIYVRQELWDKPTWDALTLQYPNNMSAGKLSRAMALMTGERKAFWRNNKATQYRKLDLYAVRNWILEQRFVEIEDFDAAVVRRTAEAEVLNGTSTNTKGPETAQ